MSSGERRPVSHVPRERERRPIARTLKRHPTQSFKRGISLVKRIRTDREVDIVGKPVSYKKLPAETEKPRKLVRKTEVVKPTIKTAKASEASSKSEGKLDVSNSEPAFQGHYELSPLLNRMLEAELQDIIKKVWELEPTNPKDEAEKIVVNRFRNKAGDYLCNTIGMNVTKRLLNVHNPLYVKMVFAGKPLRKDLIAFLKQYSICAFKRVGDKGGTFAAKMRTFQDFDDLCTNKNLKCGNIHVTVTPCYQFTTCPSNLKTPFDPQGSNKNTTVFRDIQNKATEKDPIQQNTDKNEVSTQKVSPNKPKEPTLDTKPTTFDNNTKITEKVTPVKATENKVVPKVTPAKTTQSEGKEITAKNTPAKATETKPIAKAVTKVTPPKPVENKDVKTSSNQNIAKNTISKTPITTTNKETDKNQSVVKPNTSNVASKDATPVKQNATAKLTPTSNQTPAKPVTAQVNIPNQTAKKAVPANTTTQKKPNMSGTNKITVKTSGAKTVINKQKATPVKATPKMPHKQTLAQKSKPKKKENDFDELDDNDILALLSGGIVLDECAGSDVE